MIQINNPSPERDWARQKFFDPPDIRCDQCGEPIGFNDPRPDTMRIYVHVERGRVYRFTKTLCMPCDDAEADRRGEARAKPMRIEF